MADDTYGRFVRALPITLLICLLAIPLFTPTYSAEADTLAAGLRGEYFDNEDFTALKLTRTDTIVDFNWVFGSPDPTISADTFSIRWTGQVIAPATGNYMFVTQSDDGVRLWLGNQLLIDNVSPHPLTEDRSSTVALTGGQSYNLRLEYVELTANAIIRLMWIRPGQTAPEIIPSANLATPVTANPAPTLASLSPSIIPINSANTTLTINGGNFLSGAIVQVNNSTRSSTLVSATQLTVTLTANDLSFATQFKITVINPLPGGGTSNPLTLTISGGFEADVAPRPNGTNNGTITVADWTQLGRFASGLDTVTQGNEYQRADCAPRSSLGDGRITLTDWVQAGRYSAALDPVTLAGGPIAPVTGLTNDESNTGEPSQISNLKFEIGNLGFGGWLFTTNHQPPTINHQPPTANRQPATTKIFAVAQSPNSIAIFCAAQGIENAIGFSLRFDPGQHEFVFAGGGVEGATFLVNSNQVAIGRLGVALALPPNRALASGYRRIAVLTFRQRLGNIAPLLPMTIEFADQPIAREIVNVEARSLPAKFASSSQPNVVARLATAQPKSVIGFKKRTKNSHS
ncbi:MAG: PA14 domain-containing protein [Blastocatellia bacterium]